MPKLTLKEDFRITMGKVKKVMLGFIIALGATLSIIALTESTNNGPLKKIVAGALIAVITLFGIAGLMEMDQGQANVVVDTETNLLTVTDVIDGDTIEVSGGNIIRLLGVDAPERGECYYEEAKEALDELVLGKEVRLEKDIVGTDNFGRLLRHVFVPEGDFFNDIFVNDYLLEQGFADTLFMSNSDKYRSVLIHSRNEAVTNGTGMWGACEQELKEETSTFETNDPPPNPNCLIKGNISEHGYGKTYFFPGCANYDRVKVDLQKGDKYFCTKEEAEEAGFKKAEGCNY